MTSPLSADTQATFLQIYRAIFPLYLDTYAKAFLPSSALISAAKSGAALFPQINIELQEHFNELKNTDIPFLTQTLAQLVSSTDDKTSIQLGMNAFTLFGTLIFNSNSCPLGVKLDSETAGIQLAGYLAELIGAISQAKANGDTMNHFQEWSRVISDISQWQKDNRDLCHTIIKDVKNMSSQPTAQQYDTYKNNLYGDLMQIAMHKVIP